MNMIGRSVLKDGAAWSIAARRSLACAVAAGLGGRAAAQTQVFYSDFESGVPAQVSGAGQITGVQGWAGLGPSGNTFVGMMLRDKAPGNPQTSVRITLT